MKLRIVVVREDWLGCTGLSAFSALRRMGHFVSAVSEPEFFAPGWRSLPMKVARKILRHRAAVEFNEALQQEVRNLKPDLLLVVKGWGVFAETIRRIRKGGTVCYCFYPDVTMVGHSRYLADAVVEYDWIFTTKSFGPADLQRRGFSRCSYVPHAFDPDVHRPPVLSERDLAEFGCDVSFIGGWSPSKAVSLEAIVKALPEIDLKVWGNRWENLSPASPLRPYVMGNRLITGDYYAAAIRASKVNLGLVHERVGDASSGDLITSRTFHIPASGGCMLHQRTADLLDIFQEGVHCACFEGENEMISQLTVLLGDEALREELAVAGRLLVESKHSWDHRAQTIVSHFLKAHEPPDAAPDIGEAFRSALSGGVSLSGSSRETECR